MIHHLRAIIWLRWRLIANAVRGGRRRDRFEQISRAIALVVPLIVIAMSFGTVIAVSVIGFLGGRAAGRQLFDPDVAGLAVRGTLLAVFALVIVFSITSPAQTALSRYTRLLLLPISRRVLHLVEVMANLADPWLLAAGVALVAFGAGLTAGGRPGVAIVAVLVAIVTLLLFSAVASFVSFLVAAVLRSRRRGELFTLIFVLAMSIGGFLPVMLTRDLQGTKMTPEQRRAARAARPSFSVDRFDNSLPGWTRALPTEIAGRTIQHALLGQPARVAGGLALLGLQTAGLFFASSAMHARMIRSLESDHGRRRAATRPFAPFRLPLISPAASVVGWAQLRTALRSVRGRVAVLLPGPMVAILSLLLRGEHRETIATIAAHGHLVAGVGMVFSMYGILPFTMNSFGVDRAGLTLQFLSPLRDRDLAWGKTMGGLLIFCVAAAFCVLGAAAINPTGSPYQWLAVCLGGIAVYLLLSPLAIWMSALFPVSADMSKTGRGGNPHPLSMLAGTLLVLVFAAPAALIVVVTQFWLQRPVLAPLFMTAWLAAAAIISIVGVRLAAGAITARRENLLLVAKNP